MVRLSVLATLACAALAAAKVSSRKLGVTKFEWETQQPQQQQLQQRRLQQKRDTAASGVAMPTAYNFSMPIDHFHNESKYAPHSDGMFDVTYYFDSSYYKPGGPVILLCTGEDSAIDRVPFLQTGILHQLAKSTNGIGVILEHRYYGNSFPVPDLSTENMRFLSTEQALADAAYFAQHIKFPGVEQDVTSANTPWFAYGGSYAGAFVAFLRTLYPGVFWGSLSSSGVTAAIVDYWQYFNPIQEFGPQQCIDVAKKLTAMGDNIFLHNGAYNTTLRKAFNLNNVTSNQDVTTVLMTPTNYWQAREWNPAVNDDTFLLWCGNLTSRTLLYPDQASKADTARTLLKAGGYGDQLDQLTTPLLNWFGYVQTTAVDTCKGTQDSCFALNNPADWSGIALSDWPTRCWTYQVCTQWGYFVSGNGRPQGDLGIISRLQTVPYLSEQCQLSFGADFQKLPDPSQINSWGNFDIKYPRLFFIGGQADPWRDATPLETSRWPVSQSGRGKTSHDQPAFLIETPQYGAVHHWDEYGVLPQYYTKDFPPPEVQQVQALEAKLVARWVRDWNFCKKNRHGRHC